MSNPNHPNGYDPYNSLSHHQEESHHVVLNLDHELVCQALLESLHLLQDCRKNPHLLLEASSQLQLRISFALLHVELPEFKRAEVQRLALHHNQLASSLVLAQRRLHSLHCPSQ